MQKPKLVDKLKLTSLKYFWDRRKDGFPEWDWLKDTLEVSEAELLEMFKYLGFKED